jgi:UDP-glucose 4-epimerase
MKAIVFGGSGFLGSHVADALDDAGYKVTVFDIKPSPYLRDTQRMVVGDILDEDKVLAVVKGNDVVYNFAGIADIDEARERPLDSARINIIGNSVILEAARKCKVKRFVFASSLYVYSKSGSFYRSTKQACELIIENYRERFGLPYTILRYGSLYGPRSNEHNFIYRVIRQALSEGRITRLGDGDELREYIHVADAAKGSVDILDGEFADHCVTLTGNQQMRIKDLFVMISEMLDKKVKVDFLPPGNTVHYEITPYSFMPRVGRRLVSRTYRDFSEGVLETICEVHKNMNGKADGRRARPARRVK